MQRAQCSICTDLFVHDADLSAVPCGHIFHAECLERWMQQSKTCPQCRKNFTQRSFIKKLYFDLSEPTEGEEEDPGQVKNELSTAQTLLRQKDREKQGLESQKVTLEIKVEELKETVNRSQQQYLNEIERTNSLKRELHFHKTLQKDAQEAKERARDLKKKLETLKSVELVINGSDDDIQRMLRDQGDPKQLAAWCAVIQRELTSKRVDNKQLRTQVSSLKKELSTAKRTLSDQSKALIVSVEKCSVLESDLQATESELNNHRKRLDIARRCMRTPVDTPTHVKHRLVMESPAPCLDDISPFLGGQAAKRPRLDHSALDFDLDTSADLFSADFTTSPQPPPRTTSTSKSSHTTSSTTSTVSTKTVTDFGLKPKTMKICTAAAESHGRKRDMSDISNIPGISSMNIMKKPNGSGVTAIKNGYNGLGGHGKFLVAKPKTTTIFKKPKAKPMFARNKHADGVPRLPSMD